MTSSIKRQSIIIDGKFTLQRKTRAGKSYSFSKHGYTKLAFDKAIEEYINNEGKVYLSPVCLDMGPYNDSINVRDINTNIYRNFHFPKINDDYIVGSVISCDDYTMTFKYDPTETASKMVQYITNETTVNLRYYNFENQYDGQPSMMKIEMVDLAVIPFYELAKIMPDKVGYLRENGLI